MKKPGARALLVAMLVVPLASLAAPPDQDEARSVVVEFDDLDIDTLEGAERLYLRMKRASKAACGLDSVRNLGSIHWIVEARACYQETLDESVLRVDSEELHTLHYG